MLQFLDMPNAPDQATAEAAPEAGCSLSSQEVQQLKDALWKARCDIYQTARVSEYNLTGKDPNFPGDAPDAVPNPPKLIHRAGLDESYAVLEEVCDALKMLYGKANDSAVARQSPPAGGSADHRHGFPCDLCGAKTFEEAGNLCRGFEGCPGDSMSKEVFEKPNKEIKTKDDAGA
jgi:hypothetical protein